MAYLINFNNDKLHNVVITEETITETIEDNKISSKKKKKKKISWKEQTKDNQNRLKKHISKVCHVYGKNLQRSQHSFQGTFMIDSLHKLAYCRHGKVFLNY
jgi:hypothetical protein